jgi:hypothetical protein
MAKSNKRRKDERDTKNEDELISSLVSSKRRKAKQDTENKDELISSLVSSKLRKAKQDTENKDELISSLVSSKPRKAEWDTKNSDVNFVGKPVSATEARRRWPHRYQPKVDSLPLTYTTSLLSISIYILNVFLYFLIQSEEKEVLQARNHYTQAKIDDCIYNLNDDAYVQVCSLSRFLDNYFFFTV